MALYRTGTASMDAQGVITGVGTKWREPLSLIRTGATIVFLTTPLTLAVISDIVSDTEMKAIQTNGAVVPDGNYVILLNDSLTVDGMAQDVAETLRYYQSKETEIADALEFFRDFDLQGLKDLVARIEQAAKDTDQAKLDAQAAQAGAEAAQQATNQIKQETQTIKDSAVTELTQIKDQAVTDVTAIKDQAVAETTSIKNEALDARDAAEEAQFAAEESKAGADTAKAGAETARDQAEQWAKSVSPENLLHKDQNLADVPDKEAARNALEVAAATDTFLKADNLAGIADRAAAWLNVRPIGSTPLSADPVGDYDATTKRWVINLVQGGVVGATMNGVQNWGVGEKTLWDSRAFIPQWAVPADGQLLNRSEWPELWAHAQMHSPIDDAEWLSTPSKRGMWSTGDGETTFRSPDLNGVQDGSIRGLYGRGDGAGYYVPGWVFENSVPNITGRIGAVSADARSVFSSATGAFDISSADLNAGFFTSGASTANRYNFIYLDASRSNAAYGRANASEVRPNTFAGVWIIRASGGFVAANTSWSVINSDNEAPPSTTFVSGGSVNSEYKVGTTTRYSFTSKVYGRESDPTISAAFTVADGVKSTYTDYFLKNNTVGGNLVAYVPGQTNDWNYWPNRSRQEAYFLTADTNGPIGPGSVVFGFSMGHALQDFGNGYGLQVCGRAGNMYFRTWEANSATWRLLTSAAVSDETLKHGITPTDGSESLANIKSMDLVKFVYNDDEQERERRGVIAQQIQTIDKCYVKKIYNGDDSNPEDYTLSLDTNPLLMDALSAIKYLSNQVDELKKEIAELKASK